MNVKLSLEHAEVLFAEATADFTPAELRRAERGNQRREFIRQAILRRMPA